MLAHAHASAVAYTPPAVGGDTLSLVRTRCCICDADDADPVAVGEDFEHRTSRDTFLATRCRACGLLFVNPQPAAHELARLYPAAYDAREAAGAGAREEGARRLLAWCGTVPDGARVLDVGCGAGNDLALLRDFGSDGWRLEGVEPRARAAQAARRAGLTVHEALVEDLAPGARGAYDVALLIHTLEHFAEPPAALAAVRALLRPGGRAVVVTPNAASAAWALFQGRHWAGYDFPRHRYLFDRDTLGKLAARVGLRVESVATAPSAALWARSAHHLAADWGAPPWLARRLAPASSLPLAAFAAVERLQQRRGRGALLCATLHAPV